MATDALALDTGRMDSILIYCRPRDNGRGHTLRGWLAHQAAELSARPGVERTAVVHLTTPDLNSPRDLGWLVECELANAGGAHADRRANCSPTCASSGWSRSSSRGSLNGVTRGRSDARNAYRSGSSFGPSWARPDARRLGQRHHHC
jgi:hypothetical protein